jgi:signal transduction histidine kinase
LRRKYDESQEPLAIINPETGQRVGTLHYGPSRLSQRIRLMPYLELLLLAVFFLLILWALRMKQESEQQRLFAGMAKETAHQLGTPLTSILGWLEMLKEQVPQENEVMGELGRDINRLNKISARFSQIGSKPLLDDTDLAAVVENVIIYFRRRLPHLGGRVELRSEGAVRNQCRFNRELMEWVLENLIKNGIDALKNGKGTITIRLQDGADGAVKIRVSDTGTGIPSGKGNKIFEPGFTTKERGWGMGLALVKRIITQYHGGRIRVTSSGPQGTTFAITLPGEESPRAV